MKNSPPKVTLRDGREKSVLRGHPWLFSGAIHKVEGEPLPGGTVEVRTRNGRLIGRGAWSGDSQIRVRMWTFDEKEEVNGALLTGRIADAVALRNELRIPGQTTAYRVVAAEADGIPGLIVDRYNEFLVIQLLSAGAEAWQEGIIKELRQIPGIRGIYERSDADIRAKEGLLPRSGLRWGDEPSEWMEIIENGMHFLVDVRAGHKTGFYLDQRENRAIVAGLSKDADVLNCFAYTGGFGIAALAGGATQVTNVEDVAGLVVQTEANMGANHFRAERYNNVKADVFQLLRQYDGERRRFSLIVLDPPKFAESQGQLEGAARGYKDINRLAFKLLRPAGRLLTFSCSGHMKLDLFQKIVADAALDAHRHGRIERTLGQASDHPVDLLIPETQYLKGLQVRVS